MNLGSNILQASVRISDIQFMQEHAYIFCTATFLYLLWLTEFCLTALSHTFMVILVKDTFKCLGLGHKALLFSNGSKEPFSSQNHKQLDTTHHFSVVTVPPAEPGRAWVEFTASFVPAR